MCKTCFWTFKCASHCGVCYPATDDECLKKILELVDRGYTLRCFSRRVSRHILTFCRYVIWISIGSDWGRRRSWRGERIQGSNIRINMPTGEREELDRMNAWLRASVSLRSLPRIDGRLSLAIDGHAKKALQYYSMLEFQPGKAWIPAWCGKYRIRGSLFCWEDTALVPTSYWLGAGLTAAMSGKMLEECRLSAAWVPPRYRPDPNLVSALPICEDIRKIPLWYRPVGSLISIESTKFRFNASSKEVSLWWGNHPALSWKL